MIKYILLVSLFFAFVSCNKNDDNPENNGITVESPMLESNGWEMVSATPIPNIQNVDELHFNYIKQLDNNLDIVFTTITYLSTYDLRQTYRWQYNMQTNKDIRNYLYPWGGDAMDPVTDKYIAMEPLFVESEGLADEDLLMFTYSGFVNVPNNSDFITDKIRPYQGALSIDKSFVFTIGVHDNYMAFAKKADDEYYIHYWETNLAGGINSKNELVTIAFRTTNSVSNTPTIVVLESTQFLQNFVQASVPITMRIADTKKVYKTTDFKDSIPNCDYSEMVQNGNVVTTYISNGIKSFVFDLNIETYDLKEIGEVPIAQGKIYLFANKPHEYIDMIGDEYVNHWDGSNLVPIEMPVLKDNVSNHGIYFNQNALWRMVAKKVNGVSYMYILKKNV